MCSVQALNRRTVSAQWDWAPYSLTTAPAQPGTARVFSRGIWKSVYLVTAAAAFVTHVVPHVFYTGAFPTQALTDADFAPFTLSVRTHFSAPAAAKGTLTLSVPWGSGVAPVPVSLPAGESNVTINVTAAPGDVSLWWPVGMGSQSLYTVNVTFTPSAAPASAVVAARRVGFRYFALVTGNDTDPA
jgi:beta-mannosidase